MTVYSKSKILFISWAENCSRSDTIAKLLGGNSKMVYAGSLGSHYTTVWLKYLVQSWRTWKLLQQERPRVVMVMVPPIFVCIPVYIYTKLFKAGFITDNHTAAFTMSRWQPLLFLNAWFGKRALTNVVTNRHLRSYFDSWRAPASVIGDLPVKFERIKTYPLTGEFFITVICSFNDDEPLDQIWAVAAQMPKVTFYVTGKLKDAPARLLTKQPANMVMTDFLSYEEYAGLIQGSHGVMVLTTRDHTMQRGAYEAVALGTPIITSDWPVLRETFSRGALFVDNSPASLKAAISELQKSSQKFKREVAALRRERAEIWQERERELQAVIANKLGS